MHQFHGCITQLRFNETDASLSTSVHHRVPVDGMTGRLKLARQRLFLRVAGVYRHPNHTRKITGNFDLSRLEREHLVPPETAHKIAQLDVPRTSLEGK